MVAGGTRACFLALVPPAVKCPQLAPHNHAGFRALRRSTKSDEFHLDRRLRSLRSLNLRLNSWHAFRRAASLRTLRVTRRGSLAGHRCGLRLSWFLLIRENDRPCVGSAVVPRSGECFSHWCTARCST